MKVALRRVLEGDNNIININNIINVIYFKYNIFINLIILIFIL